MYIQCNTVLLIMYEVYEVYVYKYMKYTYCRINNYTPREIAKCSHITQIVITDKR